MILPPHSTPTLEPGGVRHPLLQQQRKRAQAITSAKRPETRERRITEIIEELTDR